jgi:signal recognition particle subunit SEC65
MRRMGLFNPSAEQLRATARSLGLRADQLDREGKHADALMKRKQVARLEAKAAKREPVRA